MMAYREKEAREERGIAEEIYVITMLLYSGEDKVLKMRYYI